ncbi:uncharacterized protein PHALS_06528 [Plasmopara halstedii]|uniref:Cilia- and flagella-associated protein 157 n=1 Tax=Plasmopara halstedii TaxID=4781 RepID=A0A0P1B4S3_PLAHL|nr:uncharacterized protein PHALS_06528 [Plasmopara halstedii]CEG48716.1 hypothetical protein PHALS_06528 [Plasmopara halstedii]|eukprot:XP_024585085.1 hypothetical protein PHALS_06528 [Plasmopara halstedii]
MHTTPIPIDESCSDEKAEVVPYRILSQALLVAVSHMDPTLAFDMMLVNEHLQSQDAANVLLKQEVASLKHQLTKQTQEQSDMFQYFKNQFDKNMTRIAELEVALAEAQEQMGTFETTARAMQEKTEQEHFAESHEAQKEIVALKENLQHVQEFAQAKFELETHTRALENKLDAQRVAFHIQIQSIERANSLEKARSKQELSSPISVAKQEITEHTNDQVVCTTHRSLLEIEHLTQELAFQSQETEKVLARLDEAQQQVTKLRIEKRVLEANEARMAKKHFYYQKILAKLQQSNSPEWNPIIKLETGIKPFETNVTLVHSENSSLARSREDKTNVELEQKLERALGWLRVFQSERQYVLAQQDEVVEFLYRLLDEVTEIRGGNTSPQFKLIQDKNISVNFEANKRVEELIQLAPSITTMEAFGRNVLITRPALDELSSEDFYEVLLFILEKIRLFQAQIATVYLRSSDTTSLKDSSPMKPTLERQLGITLPPISTFANAGRSPNQKRRVVAANVDADQSAKYKSAKFTTKADIHIQAPISPQLFAMATNQFHYASRKLVEKSAMKRQFQQVHPEDGVASPTEKSQSQIHPVIPWKQNEVLQPGSKFSSGSAESYVQLKSSTKFDSLTCNMQKQDEMSKHVTLSNLIVYHKRKRIQAPSEYQ